jgi:hypothetical protein
MTGMERQQTGKRKTERNMPEKQNAPGKIIAAALGICAAAVVIFVIAGYFWNRYRGDAALGREASQNENVSGQDTQEREDISGQNTPETETEIDRTAGYRKTTPPDTFDASYTIQITGEVDKEDPPEPYCNTNADGSLRLYQSEDGGTPYSCEGLIYDHAMFEPEAYVKSTSGNADEAGGGSTDYMYYLYPKCAGETEIVTLMRYYGDDEEAYIGVLYHITVDEELRCSMDWYGRVSTEENLLIVQEEN